MDTRNFINLFTSTTFRDVPQGFIVRTFCLLPAHHPPAAAQLDELHNPIDDYPLVVIKVPVDIQGKGKVHPTAGYKDPNGKKRYSSILPLSSALNGVGVQLQTPAAIPSVKSRYSLYRKLGGPQGCSREVWKISPQLDSINEPSSLQRIATPTELSRSKSVDVFFCIFLLLISLISLIPFVELSPCIHIPPKDHLNTSSHLRWNTILHGSAIYM
jgi:hypothetical protein